MEHLGPHHLHPGHAEPISFGIDQILNSPDQGGCMGPASRLQDGEYGLGCLVGGAYTYGGGGGGGSAAGAAAGGAGAYSAGGPAGGPPGGPPGGGGACSMGPLAGSYNVNMALAGGPGPAGGGGGGGALSATGVIRVPAHRPLAGAAAHPQPLAAGLPTVPTVPAVPAVPGVNNLTGLTFPWMESNRRYTKDRFTGESAHARRGRPRPGSVFPSPPVATKPPPSAGSLAAPSVFSQVGSPPQDRRAPRVLAAWAPRGSCRTPAQRCDPWSPRDPGPTRTAGRGP